jgi:hypothetical protein
MDTVFLVVWMTFSGQNMLTVQETPAELCAHMRDSARPSMHAHCFATAENVGVVLASNECSPIQEGETFINYVCRKGY